MSGDREKNLERALSSIRVASCTASVFHQERMGNLVPLIGTIYDIASEALGAPQPTPRTTNPFKRLLSVFRKSL